MWGCVRDWDTFLQVRWRKLLFSVVVVSNAAMGAGMLSFPFGFKVLFLSLSCSLPRSVYPALTLSLSPSLPPSLPPSLFLFAHRP
jgi:hypothetical protein